MSKSKQICSVEGCPRTVTGRGWCTMHYKRWLRHGDHLYKSTVESRFWTKVDYSPYCWEWQAVLDTKGYGCFSAGKGRSTKAHRIAYEFAVGEIPEGLVIHHRCFNRACVNPMHLEVMTQYQNAQHMGKARKGSKSGVLNVSWNTEKGKWEVVIKRYRKAYRGGDFEHLDDAIIARDKLLQECPWEVEQ